MTVNPDQYRLLAALRSASVLRREPGTLTPDGHLHWWTVQELADDGRFDSSVTDAALAQMSRTARGLYRRRLVAQRTILTVTRWCILPAGRLEAAGYEADHRLADIVSAEMEADQAREDIRQARQRERIALERLAAAQVQRSSALTGKKGAGNA